MSKKPGIFKRIRESRWWYNFKDSVKFYRTLRDPDPCEGDKLMNDWIASNTFINKKLGLPPTDEWCAKNPKRML